MCIHIFAHGYNYMAEVEPREENNLTSMPGEHGRDGNANIMVCNLILD